MGMENSPFMLLKSKKLNSILGRPWCDLWERQTDAQIYILDFLLSSKSLDSHFLHWQCQTERNFPRNQQSDYFIIQKNKPLCSPFPTEFKSLSHLALLSVSMITKSHLTPLLYQNYITVLILIGCLTANSVSRLEAKDVIIFTLSANSLLRLFSFQFVARNLQHPHKIF